MLDFPESDYGVGIYQEGKTLFLASVSKVKESASVDHVKTYPLEGEGNVKPLYNQLADDPDLTNVLSKSPLVSVLDGKKILLRQMKIQLKKRKEVDAVFPFEAEPMLPYPIDQAVIDKVVLKKTKESTPLLLFATKKEEVADHLDGWGKFGFSPEVVLPEPLALANFAGFLFPKKTQFVAHLGEEESCLILLKEGELIAAQTALYGVKDLRSALKKDDPQASFEGVIATTSQHPYFFEANKRWQKELLRMLFGLEKFLDGGECKELVLTGPGSLFPVITECLQEDGFTLIHTEWPLFALSIGAALSPLAFLGEQASFRQGEFAYPDPWKRLKLPIQTYLFLIFGLFSALLVFGHVYFEYRLDGIRQEYAALLGALNQPYLELEEEFSKKKGTPPVLEIQDLSGRDLKERLSFLEGNIQKTPNLFPLQPNVPLVSDVLAWLGSLSKAQEGLQLESFSYVLVKRPEETKRKEKYQVKIELEFSSPTQKLAREFHDALINPNDFVDPKAEVKWSSSRERYRTSFYLKDKTSYF